MSMKHIAAAVAFTILAAGTASAQSFEVGPGGVRVDDGRRGERMERREGGYDRGERRERDFDRGERRMGRGGRECRTTVVRRVDRYGDTVTRRVRECS